MVRATKKLINPIKILVITKGIDGGTGTFLENLLTPSHKPAKSSMEIRVISLEKPAYRNTKISNIKFLRNKKFYPQKYSFSLTNFINLIQELSWIKKEIYKFDPDILMGIDMRCNLIAILSKALTQKGFKTIASTHIDLASLTLNISNWSTKHLLKIIIKLFYSYADKLVCVSKDLAQHLKKDFGISKKISVIYNGINVAVKKRTHTPPKNICTFISVGRLNLQKDHESLIMAASLLNKDYLNWKLWIIGDGPEKKRLQKLINKLRLNNKVKILGWVNNINKFLKQADIFVLSSKWEGFGYVLIEAMLQSLPIISTAAPHGPTELLDKGKYGILVPVGDEYSIKRAMLKLVTNKSTYKHYSDQSFKRSSFFSQEKMWQKYKELFIKLTTNA